MVDAFCRFADGLNEQMGKIGSWGFIPVAFVIFYEVVMRYVFDNPSIWSWDVGFHIQTVLIITGGGYLIIYRGHVRVDVFYAKFSQRGQRIVDLVLSPLFFLSYGMLIWMAIKEVGHAYAIKEFLPSTLEPRLWPIKTLVVVGVFTLMFQGVAQVIRDLRSVITGVYEKAIVGATFTAEERKKDTTVVEEGVK